MAKSKIISQYVEDGVTVTVIKAAKARLSEKLNGGRTARHRGKKGSVSIFKELTYPGMNRSWK